MESKIIDFTIVIQTCHLLQSILICDLEKFRLFWDILSYVVVWHCMRLIPCLLDCALLQCMSMTISSLSPCSTVAQSNPAECGTQTRQCRAWSQQNCRHWLYSKQPSNKQQPDTYVEGNICCSPQHHIIHLRFRAVFLSNLKTWAILDEPYDDIHMFNASRKKQQRSFGLFRTNKKGSWNLLERSWDVWKGVTMTVVDSCYFDEHVAFSDVAFGIPRYESIFIGYTVSCTLFHLFAVKNGQFSLLRKSVLEYEVERWYLDCITLCLPEKFSKRDNRNESLISLICWPLEPVETLILGNNVVNFNVATNSILPSSNHQSLAWNLPSCSTKKNGAWWM